MKKQALTIEQVPIDELRPDPANPRRMSEAELETLTKNIDAYGLVVPILVRRKDSVIIGGHQRVTAARRLGLTTIPVTYLDLSVEQARLLSLGLNHIEGTDDEVLLAQLLAELSKEIGLDLDLTGIFEEERHALLKSIETRAKRDQPETIDLDAVWRAAYENPRAVRGDLFQMGDHRLLCGDSTDPASFERLLRGAKADMVFSDQPYGVDLGRHGGQQKAQRSRRLLNDDLKGDAYEEFCRKVVANIVASLSGPLYLCLSTSNLAMVMRVLAEAQVHLSDLIVWSKGRFVLGRADYQRAYEPVFYGWPKACEHRFFGGRGQSDVWDIPRPDDSPLHPTTKPLALVERALENSSKPGQVVLDPFIGSGSTIVAAERTGRACYGIELDEHYCSLAVARWESFSGRKAVKLSRS